MPYSSRRRFADIKFLTAGRLHSDYLMALGLLGKEVTAIGIGPWVKKVPVSVFKDVFQLLIDICETEKRKKEKSNSFGYVRLLENGSLGSRSTLLVSSYGP